MKMLRSSTRLAVTLALCVSAGLLGCAPPAAKLVIGQPDFVSNGDNQGQASAANNTLSYPGGPAVVYQDALFVADSKNDRILRFSPVPRESNPSASSVIRSADPGRWSNLAEPYGISIDTGKMAVADMSNDRVLIWNTIPTGSETPDVVIGQKDLTSPPIEDCAHLSRPRGVALGGGKLVVSDWHNHRVLIWNAIPAQTDPKRPIAADVILGNADCTPDVNGRTRHTFNEPRGVWTDGTRLAVADTENNRVLIWSRFPTRATDDADIILGTGKPGAARGEMNGPYGIYSDGTRLFVSEWINNRVLMWKDFPARDGALPSALIGQRNFKTTGRNGAAHDDDAPLAPSATVLDRPQGVFYANGQLWVTDTNNHRILMFEVK